MYIEKLNTYLYVEGLKYPVSEIPQVIKNILKEQGCIKIKEKEVTFKCTGLLVCNNNIVIIYPKGYTVNEEKIDSNLTDATLLLKVLMKYKQESILEEELELLGGKDGTDIQSSIYSAFMLIEDYKIHGILRRNAKINISQNTGRINWPYTINKKNPIFSNGFPIYHDAIYSKSQYDENNLLILLHKYAIAESIRKYGWLIGMDQDNFIDGCIDLPCDANKAVLFLENELRKTFVQREIEVITWIKNTLVNEENHEESTKIEFVLTKTFYYVWETICSKVFDNQYSQLRDLIPQPKWYFDKENRGKPISQRPDIILIRNSTVFILDAKYYDIKQDLPGWKDAVKQFFYGLSIKKYIEGTYPESNNIVKDILNKDTVYENAFLLPSFEEMEVSKLGYISVPNISEYGQIDAFVINTRLAMRCYIGKEQCNFIARVESLIK